MKISKLRRLGPNVVLNVVLNVVPGIEFCSVWRLMKNQETHAGAPGPDLPITGDFIDLGQGLA